jgi:hypothetical protein
MKICLQCKKEFKKRTKLCSRECWKKSIIGRKTPGNNNKFWKKCGTPWNKGRRGYKISKCDGTPRYKIGRKTVPAVCKMCGSGFQTVEYLSKKAKYCSRKCFYEGYERKMDCSMERSPHWKGGMTKDRGGRMVKNVGLGRLRANARCVAEEILGRKLLKREIIHHIDGDCTNDDPKNLYMFISISAHMKWHTFFGKKHKLPLPVLESNLGLYSQ